MTPQQIITKLIQTDKIYATMYGMDKSQDKILKIKTKEISNYVDDWYGKGPALIYIWGWSGPDGNIYLFSNYGRTWAFTKKEMEN
jgi:hypothetical protein